MALETAKTSVTELITIENVLTAEFPRISISIMHNSTISKSRFAPTMTGENIEGQIRDWTTPYKKFCEFTNKVWRVAEAALQEEERQPEQVANARTAVARLLAIAKPYAVFYPPTQRNTREITGQKALMAQHHEYARKITGLMSEVPDQDFEPIVNETLEMIIHPETATFTKQKFVPTEALTALIIGIKKAGKLPLSPETSLKFLAVVRQVVQATEKENLSGKIPFILGTNREVNLIRSFIKSVTPYLSNDEYNADARRAEETAILDSCGKRKKSLVTEFIAAAKKEQTVLDLLGDIFY